MIISMLPVGNYDYITNDISANTIAVSRKTGEVIDTVKAILPVGTRCITPEEQEIIKVKKELEANRKLTYRRTKDRPFYFASSDYNYIGLDAAYMTRLIYLATFLDYGGLLCRYHVQDHQCRQLLPCYL